MLSVELPFPSFLITVLPLLSTWTQVMFGVGEPLAAQSRVRSCLSLMVLFAGGEAVNVGVTTQKENGVPDLN